MKKLFTLALLFSLTTMFVNAQDKTTVTANSSEISDNLDLRAIATIFGESSDLEDFEKRINDPKAQISNLDLNDDNYVDYLRVIESIEGNDHIIVIQSVIDKDLYQDVASIEVQRDKNNKVQVQVVGDVYMYGDNYIYEPVYVHTPVIYTTFWVNNYRPYYSSWYWNYYPSYYSYWSPFPIFRYRNHINVYIGGYGHSYNYVNYRNCRVSYNAYHGRRAHGYETRYPNRSFSHRNATVSNRHELDRTRDVRTVNTRERGNTQPRIESSPRGTRNNASTRDESPRSTKSPRATTSTRDENPRNTSSSPRVNPSTRDENPRTTNSSPRNNTSTRDESPRNTSSSPRVNSSTRNENPRTTTSSPRSNTSTRNESPRNTSSSPRATSSSRTKSSPRVNTSSRSNSGSSPRVSSPSRSSSSSVGSSRGSSSKGSSSRGGSSRGGRE
ncbi:hypothetical protein [uncultured Flavobacterium sp.]|uniref:hypothetical protein n=1 Tax=uncultured Flavobacterium sp. TaxID=165435 RepID=UPI0030EBD61A|tara:strand:+ start:34549 stop:35871 length:1323 start_codon:yes stop_codon:yes gene_type:complete